MAKPPDTRFVQEDSLRPAGLKVVTFTTEGINYMRRVIKTTGALFVDATGEFCQKVKCNADEPDKKVLMTGVHGPTPRSLTNNSRPLRIFEELSTCGKHK